MNHSDLIVGRVIQNAYTKERAEIMTFANRAGLIELRILTDEYGDQGNTDYVYPSEILPHWSPVT